MNDAKEIKVKKNLLFDLLVQDNMQCMEKRDGHVEVSLCDLLPDEEVEISGGILVNLRRIIGADGTATLPKCEYCLHMKHSEESDIVISATHFIYCPKMLIHNMGKININYRPNESQEERSCIPLLV